MKLLNGEELKLTFNLQALSAMEAAFEGLQSLETVFDDPTHALRNTVTVLRIGQNATIQRQNVMDGGHRPLYTDEQIASLIDMSQIGELRALITQTMTDSTATTFSTDEGAAEKKE